MTKASSSIGGSVGGLIGLLIGMVIPAGGVSFFDRITGQTVSSSDPMGFVVGGLYVLIGILLGWALGAIIGSLSE